MAQSKEPTKEQNPAEVFGREYQELCEKYGYRIVITPVWSPTSHGSFELVLNHGLGKLPKE